MHVASEFPLPELLPWMGSPDAEPDLLFSYGAVPKHLSGADHIGPLFQTKGDLYLLAVPGSARFLVRGGREVCVQPVDGGEEADARAIPSSTLQGVIYHQRGFFPLHASTVSSGGRAIAIAAPSGTGKSTLAAALVARGFSVIGDDICVIRTGSDRDPLALPTYPKLRLWSDAMEALGLDPKCWPTALGGKGKYLVDDMAEFSSEPVPLGDVVTLTREPSRRQLSLERLKGADAVQAIVRNIHVRRPAGALGFQRSLFMAASHVATRTRVWRLLVPDAIERLADAADAISNLPVAKA